MRFSRERSLSRRGLCLCCVGGAAYAATGGWLTPHEALAEARGLVSMFKDNAAIASIATHKLPNNISVLEGSKDDAARLLRLAAADCPKSFAEFIAANAELKELGTTR